MRSVYLASPLLGLNISLQKWNKKTKLFLRKEKRSVCPHPFTRYERHIVLKLASLPIYHSHATPAKEMCSAFSLG
jgi:hypothetical protein